jgi:riboflavin synthase
LFTGIVRHLGRIRQVVPRPEGDGASLVLEVALAASPGASVAVNGVCLTVTAQSERTLAFDLGAETIRRTTLGRLAAGTPVNVEPALRLGDPLDGHIVLGHVDGLGEVVAREPEGEGMRLWLAVPPSLMPYLPEKGSVAVDGVSLTVARRLEPDRLAFSLVPYTLTHTTLGRPRPGEAVNLEVDPIARYLETLLRPRGLPSPPTTHEKR